MAQWVLDPGEAPAPNVVVPHLDLWTQLGCTEGPFDTTTRNDPGTEPV